MNTSIIRIVILTLSILGVSLLHYLTPLHLHYLHDIFQRLYYLPIILAALWYGFRGGMACSSCHEPHGRPGKSTRSLMMTNHLRATQSGEVPCTSCHAEKRGPFVFQHGAFSVGECTTCHETHGSTNPKMLRRAEVFQLCIECHSPTGSGTVGSQPPSFHNLNSPRYRNCTSCHVAIHGSNRDPQLFK